MALKFTHKPDRSRPSFLIIIEILAVRVAMRGFAVDVKVVMRHYTTAQVSSAVLLVINRFSTSFTRPNSSFGSARSKGDDCRVQLQLVDGMGTVSLAAVKAGNIGSRRSRAAAAT